MPSWTIVLSLKSIPMVAVQEGTNLSWQSRVIRLLLPTPLSPITITLRSMLYSDINQKKILYIKGVIRSIRLVKLQQKHKSLIILNLMNKLNNPIYNNNPDQVTFRSIRKAYFYCIVMCMSTLYHGYCLTMIPATSSSQLRKYYNITLPLQSMLSLLNGVYPIGAIFGCLTLPYIIGKTSKKNYFYFLLPITIFATLLSIISSLESLLISRFMLGTLTAYYTSLSTAYLKQTFHTDIRKTFGAIYSCCRFLGMFVCVILAQIYHYAKDQIQHILIFNGPSLIALIQACLLYFFVPHSPIDMIKSKNQDLIYQSLSKFYHARDIPIMAEKFKSRIVLTNRMTVTDLGLKLVSRKNILSFHLSLLRQFCGLTFIVTYIRQIMTDAKSPLASISLLIINSVQFGSAVIGIFVASRFKRKLLVRYSTLVISFLMVLVGVADLLDDSTFTLVMMALFMVPCVSSLLCVIWSYPSQLAHGSKGKYASLISWSGNTIMSVVPPYVINAMPGRAAYPIFFFCAIYLIFASVVNYFIIVEIGTITEVRSKKEKEIQLTDRKILIS